MIKQAVILAGGKGTRLKSLNLGVPKILIDINGRKLLDIQLEELKKSDIKEILFLLGNECDQILNYLKKSEWEDFFKITVVIEETELGTGGALVNALGKLDSRFILICGDIYFAQVIPKLLIEINEEPNVILTRSSDHMFDSNVFTIDINKKVSSLFLKPHDRSNHLRNRAFTGIYVLSRKTISYLSEHYRSQKFDFDSSGIPLSIKHGLEFFALTSSGVIKDIGTPKRFREVLDISQSDVVDEKVKAIFLDRDGVINYENGYILTPSNFVIKPGVAQTIKDFKEEGYKVIVVTNQPVIARGDITFEQLEIIHAKLDTMLADIETYIDDYFICTHHPDKGFEGEIVELKIDCNCRKPKPGLLFSAIQKYNIDTDKSIMIGNSDSDNLASRAAGITYIGIGETDKNFNEYPSFKSIEECFRFIKRIE